MIKNKPTHKENIKTLIERKRQILMMQMKIDQKKEQIKFFEAKIVETGSKLRDVEQKIHKDEDDFERFYQDNLRELKEMIGLADQETKEKLEVMKQLKNLAEIRTSKLTQNSKLLEKFQELYSYKEFLSDLKPEMFKSPRTANIDDEKSAFAIASIQKFFPERNIQALTNMIANSKDNVSEKFFLSPNLLPEIYKKIEDDNLHLI